MPLLDMSGTFNPRFQGTYFVSEPKENLFEFKGILSIPVFRGLTLLVRGVANTAGGSIATFNPRFQGTYFVRGKTRFKLGDNLDLSIPVFRGLTLLGERLGLNSETISTFQSPFSGDLLC